MLLIIVFVMGHNALPHVHHQHEHQESKVAVSEHHHHGHHHHTPQKDDQEKKDSPSSLLDFLFKNHSHSQHAHQHPQVTVEYQKLKKQLDYQYYADFFQWVPELIVYENGLHRHVLLDNRSSENPYIQSHPLRGPPSLG
ncbi:hypothetical protein [Echinicola shivajiensis]|uniref:hypothetical protein n=1 Tax=Echinicola shivajiensis TaxID=1035916 RepID=UPI001BFC4BFC|nr:hypothetical protein [Echinicola shivajiensis]